MFVFLILSCMSHLYILEINPLSVASFEIIFFHSEGCLFILFIVFFAVQKLLSLIKSHLFSFVFISITLGGGSKRILLWFMSKRRLWNLEHLKVIHEAWNQPSPNSSFVLFCFINFFFFFFYCTGSLLLLTGFCPVVVGRLFMVASLIAEHSL